MKYFRNKNKWLSRFIIIGIMIAGALFAAGRQPVAAAADPDPFRIIVFVSKNIRPYVEAVDGLRERIGELLAADVEIIMLDRYGDKARIDLAERIIREDKADLLEAIGPEAAAFVWNAFDGTPFLKIYSVILNPEKVIDHTGNVTGISLNIPPAEQLKVICQGLPSVKRVGLFYDPSYNSEFFEKAASAELDLDIDVVPMVV